MRTGLLVPGLGLVLCGKSRRGATAFGIVGPLTAASLVSRSICAARIGTIPRPASAGAR